MSDIPVSWIIIAILVLLLFAFIINLHLEKSITRAVLLILMLMITVVLGELVGDIHKRFDNSQTSTMSQTTFESTEEDNIADDNDTVVDDNDTVVDANDALYDIATHVFYFISPSTKPFAREINEDCFSGFTMLYLIVMSNAMFFGLMAEEHCKNYVWYLASLISICFINSYITYILAYILSMFYVGPSIVLKVFLICILCILTGIVLFIELLLEQKIFLSDD